MTPNAIGGKSSGPVTQTRWPTSACNSGDGPTIGRPKGPAIKFISYPPVGVRTSIPSRTGAIVDRQDQEAFHVHRANAPLLALSKHLRSDERVEGRTVFAEERDDLAVGLAQQRVADGPWG